MKCRIYLTIILLIATSLPSLAQTDSTVLSRAANSLTDYFNNHPVEKAYLHLDKEYYLPDDTIWFKAYTVIGQQHLLSELSGVLYCELINNKDSVIIRENIKLLVGIGWGDFDLPRSIKPGSYHIRAYTTWMRNAGPAYFYDQKITIGGQQVITAPATGQLTAQALAPAQPDIQFFPEGGQLVNGVRSKVAIKCVNSNGLGENIKGVIVDEKGNEIADFATRHLGMGIFAITPQTGKAYKARIVTADSLRYTIDLPPAQDEGFTLAVNYSTADSIYIKVAANDKLFSTQQNTTFYLLAQSGGKVYYTAGGKLSAPVYTTIIAKSRFPTGIIQFTLFSQTGEPLNERVLFVQNDDALKINLSSKAQTYNARQKVKIDLGVNSAGNKPLAIASFSVSVTNESRVPVNENTEGTILNNLLLTSDIKGYIEQPNYYFNNENAETRANLDILMLTQGYRRFDWKQVLKSSNLPPDYMPETSLELAGSIKTPSGKPVPNGKIILTATKANYIKDTVADAAGNFKFSNLNFTDTIRTILRARKASNGSNVAIYVQKVNYPGIIKSNVNTDTIAKLTPEMLKNIADYRAGLKQDSLKNGRRLKEVTIKAKKEPKPDIFNQYGTAMEYDADMQRFRREYPTLSIALPSLIPGAHYNDGGPIIYEAHPARLIIDGLPHQTSDIDLVNVNEIESVRMISATNLYMAKLIVTTKRYAGTDTAATVLKEVKIVAKKIRKEPDLSESQNIHSGAADQVIMGDKVSGCITLSDCLNGKVFGVSFTSSGAPRNNRNGGYMSIIVDGNVLGSGRLNDINSSDIYSIEVLRSGAARSIYGTSIEAGGALVITMKHGGEHEYVTSETPQGLITYPFKGYYIARTFYSPKYDTPNTGNWKGADLRSTIYWNPNIITDKTGKASFEFYNADTKGTYRVVVEGIDDNGNIGRQVYQYKVE